MTYTPQRWRLDDLLPPAESPEMEAHLTELEERIVSFAALRETLSPDIAEDQFCDILDRYESLVADVGMLEAYSYLWFSEDTANQTALAFRARAEQIAAQAENRTMFFNLWWKALDEENATRLMSVSGDRRYFLETLRRFSPHTLSEPEERIINVKNVNGINAVLTLYDMLTSRFKFHLTVDGEEKTLTRGELSTYVTSPSAELRAAAYQELYRVYGEQTDVLAQMYANRVRDWTEENVKLRKFSSPISVRNLRNDVPDEAVETLLAVVRRNNELFQRFFRFKARRLGVDKLRRYDLYAPLSEADKRYTFDEAIHLVETGYRAFSPTLADLAMKVVQEQHLDAEVRPHKLSGAYCYSAHPQITPWVLANFSGRINDVLTLAHELGHAVHGMMAHEHSPLTFHSALPLAETASIFGEMLLTDKLLAEEQDVAVRRSLLGTFVDGSYASITRQAYFVIFEKQAHEMILNGATPDELHQAYLETLREQFGDSIVLSEDFRLEWTAIPHIYHTPFYCYAYAFGNLLVLALYRKYKQMGRETFEPLYLRILSHGGSASPAEIVGEAGFDIASADFWQGGFEVLDEMLTELEKLG